MEIEKLKEALQILTSSSEFAILVPEVRTNLVMAKENARNEKDVAGFPGRITAAHGRAFACMEPEFGASSHMARMIINIQKYDSDKRSAINLKYHPKIIEICQKLGLKVSSYDRNLEPKDVQNMEGGTIPWGVSAAVEKIGEVPDVIYHTGGWGKEPIVCLLAPDAIEAARTSVCIAKLFMDLIRKDII
ncbi:thiamine-phosphate synthase family protein [Methanobacterium alcaliphilum]|uniref:thiamine-phosphate synthase family protein n=1 Tax=Methanobacterium alcaliphilum TaxID=392018 RepID=UPI00200AB17E|nr:thiamine-phosphate synthase family protein [Methanobacterium alcaliphilum]MCK9150925.1 thiamine-phosphate synthase [Methanobacterium alcaliphilum]